MIEIDLDRAKALVEECIAERGENYVYEKESSFSACLYVHGIERTWDDEQEEYVDPDFDNVTPGCLVGFALHKAGVPLESMASGDLNEAGSYDLIDNLKRVQGLVSTSQQAANFFANVQASQDIGAPWGLAAKAAAKGETLYAEHDDHGGKTGKFRPAVGDSVV